MRDWIYAMLRHKHRAIDGDSSQISFNDLADKPAFTSASHTHTGSDGTQKIPQSSVTGLAGSIAAKSDWSHLHTGDDGSDQISYGSIAGTPVIPTVPKGYANLTKVYTSGGTITVDAGCEAMIQGTYCTNSGALSASTTAGAGTISYLYFYNSGSGALAAELSTTAPTLDTANRCWSKTGDSSRRYSGCSFINSGSSTFHTRQYAGAGANHIRAWYPAHQYRSGAMTVDTYYSIDISTWIPYCGNLESIDLYSQTQAASAGTPFRIFYHTSSAYLVAQDGLALASSAYMGFTKQLQVNRQATLYTKMMNIGASSSLDSLVGGLLVW